MMCALKMLSLCLSTSLLLAATVHAQEESLSRKENTNSATQSPNSFTFKPEVLRKFRTVLKRIFNFDKLFNTPPNLLFTFPPNLRQRTFELNARPSSSFYSNASPFTSNSIRPNNDREFLEETAEVPENSQQNPVYEQRRRYEQYWRDYYYRQQQYSPYGYYNNQNVPFEQQPQQYQQQQYSPYYYNQQQYSQQQFQNPYNPNGFSIGSGFNIGLPNGLGFGGIGLGLNLGR